LLFGELFFFDRDGYLWRIHVTTKDGEILLAGKKCTMDQLVGRNEDKVTGPLPAIRKTLLRQVGAPAKSARERALRLERLVSMIEKAEGLQTAMWIDWELVLDGGPGKSNRIRDIRQTARQTYIVREWEEGHEPHDVREFKTLEEALARANDEVGAIRRRYDGKPR
jgi:hypothetical protein